MTENVVVCIWNNIIKSNQANAAIKKGRRVEADLQEFLKDEDIELEFPIEQFGEMQIAKDKLESNCIKLWYYNSSKMGGG